MKNLFHYIQTAPHRSRSLLGIEYEQLSRLITYLQQLEAESMAQQNARKIRVNAPGAGRPSTLRAETVILLWLYFQGVTTRLQGRLDEGNRMETSLEKAAFLRLERHELMRQS